MDEGEGVVSRGGGGLVEKGRVSGGSFTVLCNTNL